MKIISILYFIRLISSKEICSTQNYSEEEINEFHTIKEETSEKEIQEMKEFVTYAKSAKKAFVFLKLNSTNVITKNEIVSRIYIEKDKERIILVFRGTSNFRNLLTDLNILPTAWCKSDIFDAQVHSGFKYAFDSLNEEIEPIIKKALEENPTFSLKIAGHSLGGALSSLAAVYYISNNIISPDKLKVFTYSEPRVGNTDFAKYARELKVKKIRVYDPEDPVAKIKLLKYQHFGNSISIENKKDIVFINQYIGTNKEIAPMKFIPRYSAHKSIWKLIPSAYKNADIINGLYTIMQDLT